MDLERVDEVRNGQDEGVGEGGLGRGEVRIL